MSYLITLDGLSQSAPDGRPLIENLTLAFGREKTGLVGRNGVGKTTLLRLILGELPAAAGAVTRAGRISLLRQQLAPPPGASVATVLGVAEAVAGMARLEAGDGTASDFEAADWTLPQRISAALEQVGLGGVSLARPADTLSGGQATRVALAALLIEAPDFILMDEPTNNLDADGRAAVARMLDGWGGGALVVSHDRSLLRTMDRIVELTGLGADLYGGGYDLYAARKADAEAAAAHELERAEQALARVGREVQSASERKARTDAKGRRTRLRRDMPKMWLDGQAERAENSAGRQSRLAERQRAEAERDLAEAEARVERIRRLAFALPPSGLPDGRLVLGFEDVWFAWPDGTSALAGVSFRLTGPERLALTGPNGAGKTTLINLAIGRLAPTRGQVRRGVGAVVLDQRADMLEAGQTLVENFRRLNPEADDNAARAALARFLFRNVSAEKRAGELSGGERLRAAMACALMSVRPPQLVILDEPTNHLDLDSIAAVEAALVAYDGAMLVASHDADFLSAIGVRRTLTLGPEA